MGNGIEKLILITKNYFFALTIKWIWKCIDTKFYMGLYSNRSYVLCIVLSLVVHYSVVPTFNPLVVIESQHILQMKIICIGVFEQSHVERKGE